MPPGLSADPSRATQKNILELVAKDGSNGTKSMKHFVGVGGVQNCQDGCYRRVPLSALIKGGVRQVTERLILRQRRAGNL
jgi:hypothetical protein